MRRPVAAALMGGALLLAGCGLVPGSGDDEAAADTDVVVTDDGADQGSDEGPAEGDEGGTDVSVSGDDAVLGSVEADVQDRHPNGHLLTVRSVEVRERSLAVQIALVNGRTDPISLNYNRLWLVDDQGNSYEFSPPEQNSDLEVGPGEELSGTVVFLGVLDPAATDLTLKTNVNDPQETIDTANRENDGGNPKFLLEGLPLP